MNQLVDKYPDIDLPPTDDETVEGLADLSRTEAIKEKNEYEALTASAGWSKVRAWAEEQKARRVDHLLLTPVTDANKDEMNFARGEISGILLVIAMADKFLAAANDALDVFKTDQKLKEGQ